MTPAGGRRGIRNSKGQRAREQHTKHVSQQEPRGRNVRAADPSQGKVTLVAGETSPGAAPAAPDSSVTSKSDGSKPSTGEVVELGPGDQRAVERFDHKADLLNPQNPEYALGFGWIDTIRNHFEEEKNPVKFLTWKE